MAKVISTKSPNIYVKDRPCKKINDRECSKDQKAKEGLIKCELQDAKTKEEASQHAHKPHFPQDDYPLDCQCYLKSQHRNYCYLFIGFFIFIGYVLLGNLSQHQGFVATTFVENVLVADLSDKS